MNKYKYSENWFFQSEIYKKLLNIVDKTKENKILEIGSFEGLSSVFFADNLLDAPGSTLTCVDPFLTIDDNDHKKWFIQNVEETFDYNISICKHPQKISVSKITSDKFFEINTNTFNFIYVDGCHEPEFVKRDIENAFQILEKDGIMWMDDYLFGETRLIKAVIDNFLEKYNGQYDLLHKSYQIAIRKL